MAVQPWIPIKTKRGIVVSSTALPISSDTIGFTDDEIAQADAIHIAVFGNPLNYQYDGEVAITGVGNGHAIGANLEATLISAEIVNKLSFIRQGSSDATCVFTLLRL